MLVEVTINSLIVKCGTVKEILEDLREIKHNMATHSKVINNGRNMVGIH